MVADTHIIRGIVIIISVIIDDYKSKLQFMLAKVNNSIIVVRYIHLQTRRARRLGYGDRVVVSNRFGCRLNRR